MVYLKGKWYFEEIKNFWKDVYGKDHPHLTELQFYIASIIEQKYMRNQDFEEWGKTLEDSLSYYNCLYRYSHTRLVNLFKISPIGIIYEYFYNKAKDVVIKSEVSLTKNKNLYSRVMQEFLQIFRKEIDISTLID